MAKSTASARDGAIRDRSNKSHTGTAQFTKKRAVKRGRREILFPTEPTSIPHERIDRAVERVLARKK